MKYLKLILLLFITNIEAFLFYSKRYKKNILLHSHTNKIQTEFEDKKLLIKSLLDVNPNLLIEENSNSDIILRQKNDINIIFTLKNNCYEMITDFKNWQLLPSPDIFLKILTQKYYINGILDDLHEEGFYIN